MLANVLAFLVIAYSGYPPYVLFYVLDNFKVNIYKSCRSYIALKYTVIDILIWKKCFDMMLISVWCSGFDYLYTEKEECSKDVFECKFGKQKVCVTVTCNFD